MAKPLELRRSRRARRIDRTKPFAERNHREKRFNNRRQGKIPPGILSNRQMELRVLSEMSLILPIAKICDEGGDVARSCTCSRWTVGDTACGGRLLGNRNEAEKSQEQSWEACAVPVGSASGGCHEDSSGGNQEQPRSPYGL